MVNIFKINSSSGDIPGYQSACKKGTFTINKNGDTTVDLGFKPRVLYVRRNDTSGGTVPDTSWGTGCTWHIYMYDVSTTQAFKRVNNGAVSTYTIGDESVAIKSITDTGFVFGKSNIETYGCTYVAYN